MIFRGAQRTGYTNFSDSCISSLDFREVQDSLSASRKKLLQKKKVTFLSSSEEAEKNHVLCFLLM